MSPPCDRPTETRLASSRVLELLREQAAAYAQLARCAERQHDLIHKDDPGALLRVLSERRGLMDRLESVATALRPVREDWATHRAALSPGDAREADRILDRVCSIIRTLSDRDTEDIRLLTAKRQATAAALHSTDTGQRALGAYRSAASDSPRAGHLLESA